MNIKEIELSDAEKFVKLLQLVDATSEFMLWEPGERDIQTENQLKMIKDIKNRKNSTILVAEKDNELIGYLLAIGGSAKRNQHSAYLVIGISKDHRGQGIGTKLFSALEAWAVSHSIRRLELTVVTENEEALSLYKKVGFEIEGTKRNSLWINDEFFDEYYMSKLL